MHRRERPSLEQQPLMNRLTRRAGGDLLDAHDLGLDPARGDFSAEPLGSRRRDVEADQLAPRRLEGSGDAVKSIDARHLRLPPLVRVSEARRARRRRRRLRRLTLGPSAGARRLPQTVGRRTWVAVALAGHLPGRLIGLRSTGSMLDRHAAVDRVNLTGGPTASFQLTGRGLRQHKPARHPPRPARGVFVVEALSLRTRGSVPSGKGGGL